MYHLFKVARKYGIATKANFILGFPRETRWQMYKTLLLQIKLAFVGVTDSPIYEFVPYPGSEETNYLVRNGVIKMNDEYFNSLCTNFSLKNRKDYCENIDGRLGFKCTTKITEDMIKAGVLEVDHIIPRTKGGKDDDENLQTLCCNCHKMKGWLFEDANPSSDKYMILEST